VLKKQTTVQSATWPEAKEPNREYIQMFSYFLDACYSFRIRYKNFQTQSAKTKQPVAKKGTAPAAAAPTAKPTHATIYVARSFPKWQSIILNTLKQMYQVNLLRMCFNYFNLPFVFFLVCARKTIDNCLRMPSLQAN